jgi:hypothetical protein
LTRDSEQGGEIHKFQHTLLLLDSPEKELDLDLAVSLYDDIVSGAFEMGLPEYSILCGKDRIRCVGGV